VLAGLDEDTRRFLLEISVLDRLSGPRCDAVTGRHDTAELLKQLAESGNLFVSPAVGIPDTYRLHQLFADILLRELRRIDPDREAVLRRRCAHWEDEHGDPDAAVRQALAAGDTDLGSELVHRHHARMLLAGQVATLESWIDSFPVGTTESNRLLAVAAGWAALTTGRVSDLRHHLESARRLEADSVLSEGDLSFDLALRSLAMTASLEGVQGTIRDARVLLDAGPRAAPWSALARSQLAVATSLASEGDHRDQLAEAMAATGANPSVHAVTAAHVAMAQLRHGDVRSADELAEAALTELRSNGLASYPMVAPAFCVAGLTAAMAGDRARSRRHMDEAEALLASISDVVRRAQIQFRQVLAETALVLGDLQLAGRQLATSRSEMVAEPDAIVLHRIQVELEQQLRHARENPDLYELSAAEQRVLMQLRTHRTLAEIADHLCVSRNTVKTQTQAIYRKLGVSNRSRAVRRAQDLGLLDLDDPDRG
jgi:LuxR family maltose regulon positive regulatory protein